MLPERDPTIGQDEEQAVAGWGRNGPLRRGMVQKARVQGNTLGLTARGPFGPIPFSGRDFRGRFATARMLPTFEPGLRRIITNGRTRTLGPLSGGKAVRSHRYSQKREISLNRQSPVLGT